MKYKHAFSKDDYMDHIYIVNFTSPNLLDICVNHLSYLIIYFYVHIRV